MPHTVSIHAHDPLGAQVCQGTGLVGTRRGETGAMNSTLHSEVLVHQRMERGCMDRRTRSVESGNSHKAAGITAPPKALKVGKKPEHRNMAW